MHRETKSNYLHSHTCNNLETEDKAKNFCNKNSAHKYTSNQEKTTMIIGLNWMQSIEIPQVCTHWQQLQTSPQDF